MSFYVFSFGWPGHRADIFSDVRRHDSHLFFHRAALCPGAIGAFGKQAAFSPCRFSAFFPRMPQAFTLANHALQIIPVILLGGVSLLLTGMRTSSYRREGPTTRTTQNRQRPKTDGVSPLQDSMPALTAFHISVRMRGFTFSTSARLSY